MDPQLDQEAYDNKKGIDALLHIGRNYIAEIFSELYKAVNGNDWEDTVDGAKTFVESLPKGNHKDDMSKEEISKIMSGSIQNWDIPLLRKMIKRIATNHKKSLPDDIWGQKLRKVKSIAEIRNETSHGTSERFKGKRFRSLFADLRAALFELGCSEETFEDIWKSLLEKSKNTLPCSFHMFPQPTNFFYGREKTLLEIDAGIRSCEMEASVYGRLILIIGSEEIGKSEIAKVMASKLKFKYDFIMYFDAQTKTSLELGFRTLASVLKIPLVSNEGIRPNDITSIYRHLEDNYNYALLIFDNAEVLASQPDLLRIDEYLQPDVDCKKPVFMVTSRNPWGDTKPPIKCIQLDRLTDEESYRCLLKYLGIENNTLQEGLDTAIKSLAQMLEGHPGRISKVGLTLAHDADNITFDGTGSRMKIYTKLLLGDSIQELSGPSKYEPRLDSALSTIINGIERTEIGGIALELLTILAHLAPERIYIGLLHGIYSNEPFAPDLYCHTFSWFDLEPSLRLGLKVLLEFSLVKLETCVTEPYSGVTFTYDMVKINPIIQQGVQKRNLSTRKAPGSVQKVVQFFEQNIYNGNLVDHIRSLLAVLVNQGLDDVEVSSVLKLAAELGREDTDQFSIVAEYLNNKNLEAHEYHALRLLELYFATMNHDGEMNDKDWKELLDFILALPPKGTEESWTIELCVKLLDEVNKISGNLPNSPCMNISVFLSWLIDHYVKCPQSPQRYCTILYYLDTIDRRGTSPSFQEVIRKAVTVTSENQMWSLWPDLNEISRRLTMERQAESLQPLLSSADPFLIRSLQFSNERWKEVFVYNWGPSFFEVLFKLVRIKEYRESLLISDGFAPALLDITGFSIKRLCELYTSSKHLKLYDDDEHDRIIMLAIWCRLFCFDAKFYQYFGEAIDRIVCDWLSKRGVIPRRWKKLPILSGQDELNALHELREREYCSGQTKKWVSELLKKMKLIRTPFTAFHLPPEGNQDGP